MNAETRKTYDYATKSGFGEANMGGGFDYPVYRFDNVEVSIAGTNDFSDCVVGLHEAGSATFYFSSNWDVGVVLYFPTVRGAIDAVSAITDVNEYLQNNIGNIVSVLAHGFTYRTTDLIKLGCSGSLPLDFPDRFDNNLAVQLQLFSSGYEIRQYLVFLDRHGLLYHADDVAEDGSDIATAITWGEDVTPHQIYVLGQNHGAMMRHCEKHTVSIWSFYPSIDNGDC